MVRTYGLTHINLVVRDVERSSRFYGQVFGVEEYGRTEALVHTRTPGCRDVITFDEHSSGAGESRGIPHFGFRLVSPGDIDAAVEEVERAGERLAAVKFARDVTKGRSVRPSLRENYDFFTRTLWLLALNDLGCVIRATLQVLGIRVLPCSLEQ
jgi:extradiol dioxygenase family protein